MTFLYGHEWQNWLMPLAMILFWGLLFYFILSKPQSISVEHKESPLEIAKRWLASGEIDSEEFEQIKQQL
ncbi:hypothetical protein [Vibrio marisflavi]|uniref:SHOCT domain-containing protein n=1 Tax=Vibrio marisflavi CECT 7928 TaxID=634439 RepID=A0ABM9A3U8_9VIBR|nr:hypothetical protein [Vibrio marisflavi]CAH0539461.1 hypothetical protein VMF7928_02166 [Vibrio marisflavi CECT 7928]